MACVYALNEGVYYFLLQLSKASESIIVELILGRDEDCEVNPNSIDAWQLKLPKYIPNF